MIILHGTKASLWETAKSEGIYGHEQMARFGYIHCSDIHTLHRVNPRLWKSGEPMVLLSIDTDRITSETKWEDGGSGVLYPHIYGLISTDCVVDVQPLKLDIWGRAKLNTNLRAYMEHNN